MSLSAPTTSPIFCSRTALVYAGAAAASLTLCVSFTLAYMGTVSLPYDGLGYLVGRDFVNTWMGARAALAGEVAPWFDFETYNAALHALFGPALPLHAWSYPPHLLLFTWPLGFLPYLPAYLVWCVAGYGLYLLVLSGGDRRPDRLLFLAVAPAAAFNILTGQNGFFTAALLVGGFSQLDRRPVAAGALFGLLTLKPQLGLLLPLMLLLTARWRVIATAAVTAGVLALAAATAFGPQVWIAYVQKALPMQLVVLTQGGGMGLYMTPTAFGNMRLTGLPLSAAWTVQALVSAASIAAVTWTFWRRRDPVLSLALLVTATFLVTPYAFVYDMVVFGWVIARLREQADASPIDHVLALAVWTLPVTAVPLVEQGLPVSSLVLVAFAARLLWRLAAAPDNRQIALAGPDPIDMASPVR